MSTFNPLPQILNNKYYHIGIQIFRSTVDAHQEFISSPGATHDMDGIIRMCLRCSDVRCVVQPDNGHRDEEKPRTVEGNIPKRDSRKSMQAQQTAICTIQTSPKCQVGTGVENIQVGHRGRIREGTTTTPLNQETRYTSIRGQERDDRPRVESKVSDRIFPGLTVCQAGQRPHRAMEQTHHNKNTQTRRRTS